MLTAARFPTYITRTPHALFDVHRRARSVPVIQYNAQYNRACGVRLAIGPGRSDCGRLGRRPVVEILQILDGLRVIEECFIRVVLHGPPADPPIYVSPQYHAAGNLKYDPLAPNVGALAPAGQWYKYDKENRVVRVRQVSEPIDPNDPNDPNGPLVAEYEHDVLGRRIHTTEYVDPVGRP